MKYRKPRGVARRATLSDDILSLLIDQRAPYRIMHRLLEGRYESMGSPSPSPEVLRSTLSRLKRNGLVASKDGTWVILKKGIDRLRRPGRLPSASSVAKDPKNMIVLFDIPERESRKRVWLRAELAGLDFTLLQKSAWFGPGPLPKEFIEALHNMALLPYLRFFAATEADIA